MSNNAPEKESCRFEVKEDINDKFNTVLSTAISLFKKSDMDASRSNHKGVLVDFRKVNKKEELINRVCQQLEKEVREYLSKSTKLYGLSINNITLTYADTQEDFDNSEFQTIKPTCDAYDEMEYEGDEELEEAKHREITDFEGDEEFDEELEEAKQKRTTDYEGDWSPQ